MYQPLPLPTADTPQPAWCTGRADDEMDSPPGSGTDEKGVGEPPWQPEEDDESEEGHEFPQDEFARLAWSLLADAGFLDPEVHFPELKHIRPFNLEGDPATFRCLVLASEKVSTSFAVAESLLVEDLYRTAESDGVEKGRSRGEEEEEEGGGESTAETWPLASATTRRREILSPLLLGGDWKDLLARTPDISYMPFLDLISQQAAARVWFALLEDHIGSSECVAGEDGGSSATESTAMQLPAAAEQFRNLADTTISADFGTVFVRCKTWKAVEVAVAHLRKMYGYNLEFHGTSAQRAKMIARGKINAGDVPNEFSTEMAIYTTPSVTKAFDRACLKHGAHWAAVVVCKPAVSPELQVRRLDDDALTRQFVFNNVHYRKTEGFGEFDVVIGKTCRYMHAPVPERIILDKAIQHCYVTPDAMADLNLRKVPVVLEFRGS